MSNKKQNMKPRQFNEKDFPAIFEIYAASKLDELQYEISKFELLPLEKDAKRLNQLKESNIYVYGDNYVAGYGAYLGSEIRALFVHPKHRREGIGRKIFEHLLSKIIEKSVILYVAKSNVPAQNLYKNYGFQVVEEFKTSYNGVQVTANKMMRLTE